MVRSTWPLWALYASVCVIHLAWWMLVQRQPSWDQAHHLTLGLDYARAIHDGTFLTQYWDRPELYPPGYHLLLALATLVLGPQAYLGLVVNLLLMPVLLVSVWRIGVRTYGNFEGLLAAFLVSLYPAVAIYTREALIEFSLMALAGLAILLLLQSDLFERRRSSAALGVTLGVGLLFKPNFGFYFWLPVGSAALVAVVRRRPGAMLNLALAALLALGISLTWYLPQLESILELAAVNRADGLARGHTVDNERAFLEYLASLAAYLMTGVGVLLAVVGMGSDLLARWRRTWVLHAWVVGSWVIVILALVYRDPKYLLPCLPALALFTAAFVGRLPPTAKRASAVALVGFLALHFSVAAFGVPRLPAPTLKLGSFEFAWWSSQYYWGGLEGRGPWAYSEIVDAVAQRHPGRATVAVVPNKEWFNVNLLTWEARRRGVDVTFRFVSDGQQFPGPDFDELDRFTYLVLKSGDQGAPHIARVAEQQRTWVRTHPERYQRVMAADVADGSTVELFLVEPTAVRIDQVRAAVDQDDRGARFGTRFMLLNATWERTGEQLKLRLSWKALRDQRLDYQVAVHLVDESGTILTQADYPQNLRSVREGEVWLDVVPLSRQMRPGVRRVGLCLYKAGEERLPVDSGLRDWNNGRLLIELPGR